MEELKNCPFCGSGDVELRKGMLFNGAVHCNNCTADVVFDAVRLINEDGIYEETPWKEAVTRGWNRRVKEPPVQPEIIHCCDCIYYDPEHIEKNGVRYEYKDMPKAVFDIPGIDLVDSKYGINVGGRCCRDYNVGYSEDKRVYVSKQNYCGRAERRTDE